MVFPLGKPLKVGTKSTCRLQRGSRMQLLSFLLGNSSDTSQCSCIFLDKASYSPIIGSV